MATRQIPIRRNGRRGQSMIEFSLVFIVFVGMVFGFSQLAFWVWAKTALHYAVREGVRYGITGELKTGLGHSDSIKSVVMGSSAGLLSYVNAADDIFIEFFDDDGVSTPSNSGGNTIVVSVRNFNLPVLILVPGFGLSTPPTLAVSAVQKLEPYPVAPPL